MESACGVTHGERFVALSLHRAYCGFSPTSLAILPKIAIQSS